MWVAIALKEVTTLVDDGLELLTVGKVVTRKLLECLVVFTAFDHIFHLNDDFIQLALLFDITALRHLIRCSHLVQRQRAIFVQT